MIPDKLNIRVPVFSKAAGPAPRRFHVRRVRGGVSRLPGEPPGPLRAARGSAGAALLRARSALRPPRAAPAAAPGTRAPAQRRRPASPRTALALAIPRVFPLAQHEICGLPAFYLLLLLRNSHSKEPVFQDSSPFFCLCWDHQPWGDGFPSLQPRAGGRPAARPPWPLLRGARCPRPRRHLWNLEWVLASASLYCWRSEASLTPPALFYCLSGTSKPCVGKVVPEANL